MASLPPKPPKPDQGESWVIQNSMNLLTPGFAATAWLQRGHGELGLTMMSFLLGCKNPSRLVLHCGGSYFPWRATCRDHAASGHSAPKVSDSLESASVAASHPACPRPVLIAHCARAQSIAAG